MTDSDGDVSFGRASESDSVPEELVDWETDSPAFGDTPPFPGNGGTRVMSYAGGDAAAALECAALAAGSALFLCSPAATQRFLTHLPLYAQWA